LAAFMSMQSEAIGACRPKYGRQKIDKIIESFGLFNPVPAIFITSPGNVHTQLLLEDIPEPQAELKIHDPVISSVAQEYWRVLVAANISSTAGKGHPTAKANESAEVSTRKHGTDSGRASLAYST
jgi:hypothetical protein